MDQFKKHELKQKIKKYKPLILGTGIFLVVGLIAFFVGMYLSGTDIIAMLVQPFAITVYIISAIGICVLIILYYIFWIKDKGKGE